MPNVSFCTCADYECACHPANHEHGCTPCIAKNLKEDEIPTCFFRKIEPDMDRKQDYSARGYARFVRDHKGI